MCRGQKPWLEQPYAHHQLRQYSIRTERYCPNGGPHTKPTSWPVKILLWSHSPRQRRCQAVRGLHVTLGEQADRAITSRSNGDGRSAAIAEERRAKSRKEALLRQSEWVSVRESVYLHARADERATSLELQQLVITLDSPRGEVCNNNFGRLNIILIRL